MKLTRSRTRYNMRDSAYALDPVRIDGYNQNYNEQLEHLVISRRNVESLTFLDEESSHPGFSKNEDDAFVSAAYLGKRVQAADIKKILKYKRQNSDGQAIRKE